MEHRVASRFDERYRNDRCPNCKLLNQNFIWISDKELGCYNCGLQFITYEARTAMKLSCREMLKNQEQDFSGFQCSECNFKAKSKAGLAAHMKVHR